jgi:GNAT superfamily N-acetyltransferase
VRENVTQKKITIRTATVADATTILHHRGAMFRDMREGTADELDRMAAMTGPWLEQALFDGSYRGWLAEEDSGRVVGGGGVLLCPWPASPKDPGLRRAIVLNVYTEPEFRHRGIARRIMVTILGWLEEQGFPSVSLHASDEGRHLYEELGFKATNEMRLRFGAGE